ncbi:MAG: histidinol-phosphate transaminase [Bacteroidota bacterium]
MTKKEAFSIQDLVRKNVRSLQPYSSARDEYSKTGGNMVFMDANENPFNTLVNRYPDPQQRSLKQRIAERKGVAVEQVFLGNGSDEVLDLLYRAFCEPSQDNVITLPPTYGMYKVLGGINDVEIKEVLLLPDFQPDVERILEAQTTGSKLLFICSPNNPTGNILSAEKIHTLLQKFKGLVVIDEAYADFSKNPSWIDQIANYPNLVVTQTFSKALGMAGIRLGVCYASSEIISVLNRIKPPYNVNELTQQFATERFAQLDRMQQELKTILEQRQRLVEALVPVSFIAEVYPSDANFLLIRVDDARKRYQQLLQKGIVVRNRSTQPLCENTLRITVGTPEENELLIQTLNDLIV